MIGRRMSRPRPFRPPALGTNPGTCLLAEEERFELPVPFGTAVFKTAALNHSATPPQNQFSGIPEFGRVPRLLFSCSFRAIRVARRRGPTRAPRLSTRLANPGTTTRFPRIAPS